MSNAPTRQIPLPPLSQHLREFATRRDAWLILARNLIPVVGIYVFSWSAALAVFNYWFDGLAALAAIVAALTPRALRETVPKPEGVGAKLNFLLAGIATWLFLVGIVGLPYWVVLIPLHEILLGDELRQQLLQSQALWVTFGALAAGHFWKAFHVGYDTMPEQDLKQRARWDLYLLILRALAMFMMAGHGLAFIMVPLMALLLSYFEIWPARVLGAVFGDPDKLWRYDPEKTSRRGWALAHPATSQMQSRRVGFSPPLFWRRDPEHRNAGGGLKPTLRRAGGGEANPAKRHWRFSYALHWHLPTAVFQRLVDDAACPTIVERGFRAGHTSSLQSWRIAVRYSWPSGLTLCATPSPLQRARDRFVSMPS